MIIRRVRFLLFAALFLGATSAGWAQVGGGPGPVPNPWMVSGSQISYPGCVLIPATVSGGCKGNGTLNLNALYVGGVAFNPSNLDLVPGTSVISPSTSGGVLFDNAGVLGDSKTLPSGLTLPSPTFTNPSIGAGSAITSSGPGGALTALAYASFGTASGNVAQGGVITAGGPIGSATVTPIITYNAAGQLTAVTTATIAPAWSSITSTPTTLAGYGITNGATNGANSNITSLTGLTTPLATSEGGTGLSTFTLTGNTTKFATSTGTLTSGHCVQLDSNLNFVDAGGACTTGGGGGTVSAGTANDLAYYVSSGTAVTGLASANNGVLVTSSGGVPSISATLPSGLAATNLTLTTPILGTPQSGNLANTSGYPAATTSALGTVSTDGATIANTGGAIACRTATSSLLGCASFGTGLTVSGGAVTPAFGTATNQVAEGGVITGAGPVGSVTAVPVITYNAAGQLTAVTTAALGTAAADNTGTSGSTVPLNNGGFTQSGTVNFTGTFEIGGFSVTWPGSALAVSALNLTDQTASGGANLTVYNASAGNYTVDCGKNPGQWISNVGAFTITAPANDGECVLQMENGSGAGIVSFSGFSEGTNVGDSLTTINGNKFQISVIRIHSASHYLVTALQ